MFKQDPGGSRNGKIVLVQHRDIQDTEMGGQFTVKRYRSEKVADGTGGWKHQRIILEPESTASSFEPIELENHSAEELYVAGELVAVIS